jgi:hypothetical protein
MEKEKVMTVVNAIIERFDDLEEETGVDYTYARRIILRWFNKKFPPTQL